MTWRRKPAAMTNLVPVILRKAFECPEWIFLAKIPDMAHKAAPDESGIMMGTGHISVENPDLIALVAVNTQDQRLAGHFTEKSIS